jgi:predicted DNA-binding transcriptional regulator AlpA
MRNKSEKQTDGANEPMISQAKAAEMCGMTRAAIYNLVRRGRFRSIEVEGRDLVYLEEVAAFAAEQE